MSAPVLTAGMRLGQYKLVRSIGAGGMGEVWRARDITLDREVAIKLLPDDLARDQQALARFEREAKLLAILNHGNIAQIYGFEESNNKRFLVLELVEGRTLSERLTESRLSCDEALDVGKQIAEALEAAHEKGIVHRDLKPGNVMLREDGSVKVLDFGLACTVETRSVSTADSPTVAPRQQQVASPTIPGMIMGTAGYMSPEQAQGKTVDKRSDIFSFGIILLECLTGKNPFADETVAGSVGATIHLTPDWSLLPTNTPLTIQWLLRRCLVKNCKARLQDIADARVEIEGAIANPQAGSEIFTTAGHRTSGSRSRLSLILTLLLVATFAIAGGWLVSQFLGSKETSLPVKISPITFSGRETAPAVSPDGRTLAFVSWADGLPRIWVKDLAGAGDEAVLTDGPDTAPRFAPDGSFVLFARKEDNSSSIYRVARVGGAPRKLIDNAYEADLHPDGTQIAFLRMYARGVGSHLMLANLDGKVLNQVLTKESRILSGVRWSSDGKTVAVTMTRAGGINQSMGNSEILLVSIANGVERALKGVPEGSVPTQVSWSGPDELIYGWTRSNSAETSISQVVRHSINSSQQRPLFWAQDIQTGRQSTGLLEFAGPGKVVFAARNRRQNLFEIPLANRSSQRRQLTRGYSIDRQPVYSPDRRIVVFSSNRGGALDLWALSIESGNVNRLTDHAAREWDPAFTRDGQHLLWSSNRTGNYEVWMSRVDGTEAMRVTRDGESAQNPTMSADGQWIVYAGGKGITKIRTDGTEEQLLVPGSHHRLPVASPRDPLALFVTQQDNGLGNRIRVVNLETGEIVAFEIQLAFPSNNKLGNNFGRAIWVPDGKAIAFVGFDEASGQIGVFKQGFSIDKNTLESRQLLATLGQDTVIESFDLSHDSSHIVVSNSETIERLMMVENVPSD